MSLLRRADTEMRSSDPRILLCRARRGGFSRADPLGVSIPRARLRMGKGTEAAWVPLRLRCAVQNYDWGRFGEESAVARLFERNSGAEVELERPYAEFWIGTHESGPSFVEAGGLGTASVTLKEWIGMNPGVLGEKVEAKWGRDLPFLFKVLSVAKALSIQAHPDKELARMLHEMRPNVYKDPNHKPEMAIALTEFKALCGFIGVEELKNVLTCVPEITELVGNEEANKLISAKSLDEDLNTKVLLKSIFTKLMSTSKEAVADLVSKLKGRLDVENKLACISCNRLLIAVPDFSTFLAKLILAVLENTLENVSGNFGLLQSETYFPFIELKDVTSKSIKTLLVIAGMNNCFQETFLIIRTLTEKEQLVLLLEKQYQADVGVIAAFFFNYLRLNPGEALYIGPNEPHAYLSGECIECMAASDNVVRAGLTPKYIDVQTLCSMLTYRQGFPEIIHGVPLNPHVKRYTAPFDEFEVDHCLLQPKESVVFPAIPGPSIFLVVAGEGKMHMASEVEGQKIAKGDVYFVPTQNEIRLSAAADEQISIFRAGVNSRIFD
ncbi:hypothetical protein ZIOFF_048689 [Zingiber officinale]|uniref:mannose-6-phosphate isomerase n=1 Tax=Zingiber officinale TaxID=94328 RepID=A0A8J5FVJ5_ZINOF|nr:hypothetical protein ZIOFF_048689 [Zingiber officinale]